jgi:plasmid stabilization system protein ParE
VTPKSESERPPAHRRRARRLLPVVWTDRALSDLEAIGDYIASDDLGAAQCWVMRLIAVAARAAAAPQAGRRVPELGRDDIREVFLRSYRVVYRVTAKRLEVVTVFEGHRLFPHDLDPASEET